MTQNRRRALGVAAAALAVLLLVSFTIAYLTDQRRTLNVLGINTDQSGPNPTPAVKIKLTEPGFAADPASTTEVMNPGEADEYAKITLVNILPGQKINKDPTVTNIGTDKVYVRIRLQDSSGNPLDLARMPADILHAAVDTGKWTHKNGYWYYTNGTANCALLDVGGTVPVLKTTGTGPHAYTMLIPEETNNTELAPYTGLLNFEVIAEAIQGREFTPDMAKPNPWSYSNGTPVPVIPAIR